MRSLDSSYISKKVAQMQSLSSYSSQTTSEAIENQDSLLRLDSNENLLLPEAFINRILGEAIAMVDPRRYHSDSVQRLSESLADYLNVEQEEIVIGAGGDGIIDLVAGPLMNPNDSAMVIEPTFLMFQKCLNVHGRGTRTVYLQNDFSLCVEEIQEQLFGTNEVVFLCSPNNPTGNQFPRDDVRAIVESTEGLVVLDEAYTEFAPESLLKMVYKYDNLLVLRTFSKAFGLAGMRVGYAVTGRNLAQAIQKHVILPYPVATLSTAVAFLMLNEIDEIQRAVSVAQQVRERLSNSLEKISGVTVYTSDANFVLIQIPMESTNAAQMLQATGIKVRIIDWMHVSGNFLRITVPPEQELDRVIDSFKEVLG
ncbi:MAG: histidinol-phosphate transaminase [Candidatus Thorarchaeota archaeon]